MSISPDDPQGRCSNCIRLKKECNFYPVEQQNPGESRSQAAKRGSVSQVPSSSSSSSPRASNTSGHDGIEEYSSFQPMPAGEPPPGFAIAPELDGPIDTKSGGGTSYSTRPQHFPLTGSAAVPHQSSFPYSPGFDMGAWGSNYPSQTPSDGIQMLHRSRTGPQQAHQYRHPFSPNLSASRVNQTTNRLVAKFLNSSFHRTSNRCGLEV